MATKAIQDYTNIGTIQNGDTILGERVPGTTIKYTVASSGTGDVVLTTSPELVTPLLGTPTSGTLTNCTGLPIASGVSGLAAGAATFLATPSSANFATMLTDETGSGSVVLSTSPTLVTPLLGTPTSGTLTNCTGLPIASGVSGLAAGAAAFLATPSSANFATLLTDETGSGSVVLATSPTLVTPILGTPTSGTLTNCTGLTVAGGGTGVSTMTTAYAPICAGTTATGAVQVASTGMSSAGYVLTSNGASALPSFQASGTLGYTTTAVAGSNIVLTNTSTYQQFFTGSTATNIVMPVASTMTLGQSFLLVNNSTATLLILTSGSSNIRKLAANCSMIITCILTSGTTAASWDVKHTSGLENSYQTIATSAGTTAITLTGTPRQIFFTGTTTHTLELTSVTDATLGTRYRVVNNSTGTVTVKTYASGFTILAVTAGQVVDFTCINTASDVAASWDYKITQKNQTAMYAYPSASQSIAASTATKVQNNTENFDRGPFYDNATNYRFTPAVAGYYFAVASITMLSIGDGKRVASNIYKNGAGYFFAQSYSSLAGASVGANASGILYLNGSTDYIEHYVFHDDTVSRSTFNDQIYSYFMAVLVEAA